jgi:hypothetical protein
MKKVTYTLIPAFSPQGRRSITKIKKPGTFPGLP